jgi:hypothetical protein
VLTYASVTAGTAIAFGVVGLETWRARGGRPAVGTVRLAGLVGTPGFHLVWLGMVLTIVAAPIDDLWHRLFGIDVTLWSPPHLLGLAGAQVSTLALLITAREVWPAGSRARPAAVLAAGTLLFGTFAIIADPAHRIAFLYGGLRFFTWPVLLATVSAFSFVLTARLAGTRWAPVAVTVLALVLQLSMWWVADVGFYVARPVSVIHEVLAADDGTSPIAVAHEMARRNGATPGRSLTPRVVPLLPALVLALVDARRRGPAPALAFGAAMFAAATLMIVRMPALSHAMPGSPAFVAGLALTLLGASAGAALGGRLAARIEMR